MNKLTTLFSALATVAAAPCLLGQINFGDVPWYHGGAGGLALSGDTLIGTTGDSSSSWTIYLAPEDDPISLENASDRLTVEVKFSMAGVNASNSSQNFRIGLLDSPTAARLTADGDPPSGPYTGYAFFMNIGETTGNGNSFQLRERNAANDGATLGTSSLWGATGSNGLGNGMEGYSSDAEYTLVITVTRTSAGAADVKGVITGPGLSGAGSATVQFVDTTPQPFTFDTLVIRPSNALTTASSFTFTSFSVTPNNWPATVSPVSLWAQVDALPNGWRNTNGVGGLGCGWVYDPIFPWVYFLGLDGGDWAWIHENGTLDGFWAWKATGAYWIYGLPQWGLYYSTETGAEGWYAFAR
jgi:hypothetical protein